MTRMVEAFRQLYNHVRPHEHLAGDRPIERYLAQPAAATDAEPSNELTAPLPTRQPVRIP